MSFTDHSARWFLATLALAAILVVNKVTAEDKEADQIREMGIAPQILDYPFYPVGGTPDDVEATRRKRSTEDDNDDSDDSNSVKPLVTHGEDAYPAEFRYQAALLVKTSSGYYFICGASVLTKRHVMTAAHCIGYLDGTYGNTTYEHYVMMGTTNLTLGFASPHVQVHKVKAYKKHHQWTGNLEKGDLAILYMATSIVNNSHVQFAKLPKPSDGLFSYNYCYITGWGLTEEWKRPDILQWAAQISIPSKRCDDYWAIIKNFKITNRLICSVYYPRSVCFGDSGGPLTCRGFVVGVTSWVESGCRGCRPSGFTRVTFYYAWIRTALKKMKGYVMV